MSDDYYALLELTRDASADEIRTAIREQRRVWVRRQSSPDPERRTFAEQRVRDLDAAEKVLLDANARADYDRRLGRQSTTGGSGQRRTPPRQPDPTRTPEPTRTPPRTPPRTPTPSSFDDSTGNTGRGRYDSSDPDVWRSRASDAARRGDHAEAIRAYNRLITLAPQDRDARRGLADSYLASEQYRQAVTEYEAVLATDPEDGSARAGLAECYLHTERVDDGLSTLKALVEAEPDNHEARHTYAYALYQQAWDGLAEASDGKLAMSRRQVRLLRRNARSIRSLNLDDPQVEGWRTQLERMLQDATRRRKIPSDRKRYYAGGVVVALFLALAGPAVFHQVVGVIFLVAIAWMYAHRHRPPMWQIRRKQLRRQTVQRGI